MAHPAASDAPNLSPALARAIEEQLAQWRRLLVGAAHRHALDATDLDEVEQDVRIRLWRHAARDGVGADPNPSYVYRTIMSALMDLLRKRRVRERRQVQLEDLPGALPSRDDGPDADTVTAALERALGQLDLPRRIVVRLHLDGVDRAGIASTLGWTEAKARNLLYRGLADLRASLQQEAGR